jgi:outer membrane protein assembly factor BamB
VKRSKIAALVLGAWCLIGFCAVRADNWPSWRGLHNNAVSKETNLPTKFGIDTNLAWKLKMPGIGGSTPAVWGERMFLTSGDNGGKSLVVLCVTTAGELLWKEPMGGPSAPNKIVIKGDEGNEASPSPSTDGKNVFVFFGNGEMASFDFDGKKQWQFNVQDRYGKFNIYHGIHNSPLLYGDRLYLSLQHDNGHWVAALDKFTGKEIWKVERKTDAKGESKQCYTSPCLWSDGKDSYLVVSGCDYATAHSLKDGSEIWRTSILNPKDKYSTSFRIISSPVATPDVIIIPTAREAQVIAMKPSARGELAAGSSFEQWRIRQGGSDVPTPVVHDGLVYLCAADKGILSCVEAKTGKLVYSERIHSDRYRASPVYADGKIYLIARGKAPKDDSRISVVKAGPKFDLLEENRIPDEITASPAISNGRLYVRGFKWLYAFEQSKK